MKRGWWVITILAVHALAGHGEWTTVTAQPAAKTWTNVMYLGGAPGVRGKALNWDNRLTVSPEAITFSGKNDIRITIDTAAIRSLDYTGHKHSNDEAAVAGLIAGGLIGAFAGSALRSTDHYLMIEYTLPEGDAAAVLFRLNKKNHEAIIQAVREVTNVPGED